jgi:hypothetical protein
VVTVAVTGGHGGLPGEKGREGVRGNGGAGGAVGCARTAYVIQQREGRSVSVLTLAPSGLRYEALAPARRGGRAKPFLGLIIRYPTRALLLLDPEKRRYEPLPLASAISSYEAELQAVRGAQPSERLPARPGTKPQTAYAPALLTVPGRLPRASENPDSLRASPREHAES